ncbi:ARS binding protein 2 domain-containing protein [Hirsutella rhossiliensis]|uniref:ARS binding protein 2 domain-containing protein n=1 Tax=Hirsutella rhossiliensis TaxID=111463 RepID=A0A9P8SNA1_9HYPO|nr:ARS binding protein 2 domain-containing protein [Hirsutella rhossiliensis]KAH0966966.1 ARS binding protein 2 domain-containing protein [Hirsutella rhossiliensis]
MPSSSREPAGLPDRHVTADSIEDAYVRFIFYCNPALPHDADTASLREAFRSPPRSGGKVFHPFTIFGLVARFYARDIKTWTELTTLLGVEPPDLSKDESAQKVAQYGVRLKKWMNSMHVRAFFEYLMSMPNDYWTNLPADPNPIACPVRDGVAVEDDMALRALIPHIRPKRGRKRPDADEPVASPAQKSRLSDPSMVDDHPQPWSAHPPGQGPLPAAAADPEQDGDEWGRNDSLQTPLSRWPQSVVTPSSRGTFWDDTLEPRSAVTPSRPKPSSHRRGAKNVSSAWKPGGICAGAKQRGRPPVNRTPVDGPSPASQSWKPFQDVDPSFTGPPPAMKQEQDHYQPEPPHHENPHKGSSRPSRPSISLQVPEREGGAVRLATPPSPRQTEPAESGQQGSGAAAAAAAEQGPQQDASQTKQTSNGWERLAKEATDAYEQASNVPSNGCEGPENMPEYYFEKMEDRTNVDALVSYFVRSMSDSEWVDLEGNPDEPASVEESTALVNAMLQNMFKTSTSPQAFLINLAALAGSMTLVTTRPKCVRMGENDDSYVYKCDWEYRFGHVKGGFTMPQYVPRTMWKKPEAGPPDAQQQQQQQQTPLTAEDWKRKYQALAEEVHKRNTELAELRTKVMTSLGREWMEP